jgi:hypothetical protein
MLAIIALTLIIAPWFLIAWLWVQRDEWRERAECARLAYNDAAFELRRRGPLLASPPPLVEPDGSRVVPFEPRVIEGGKADVVEVPIKGRIS